MYPNLYYLVKDLFGIGIPAFKIINTFGLCVAIAFLAAAWLLVKELKRKQAKGIVYLRRNNHYFGRTRQYGRTFIKFCAGFCIGI